MLIRRMNSGRGQTVNCCMFMFRNSYYAAIPSTPSRHSNGRKFVASISIALETLSHLEIFSGTHMTPADAPIFTDRRPELMGGKWDDNPPSLAGIRLGCLD